MPIDRLAYLDLFSGVGGFRLGLERAGFEFGYTAHSEIDKYANTVYLKHWPESEDLGDVRNVIQRIGTKRIDFITFGFPCQDLSVAGKGRGLEGSRSGLFFDAAKIVRHFKPEIFIFENVKGLLTDNGGKSFEVVLRTIADIGIYECEWQLLNTRWFLPQNRERVYFIGHLRGSGGQKVFPIRESDRVFKNTDEGKRRKKVATTVRGGMSGIPGNSETYISYGSSQDQKISTDRAREDGSGQPGIVVQLPRGKNKGSVSETVGTITQSSFEHNNCLAIPVCTPDTRVKNQNGRIIKDNGDPMFTIDGSRPHGVMVSDTALGHKWEEKDICPPLRSNTSIRRLTPCECSRLQGFPDDWCNAGISDSQKYKMLGNAVSVPVVEFIGRRLLLVL